VAHDDIAGAWDAVHGALVELPGWEAADPRYNAEERLWAAYAHDTGHVHARQTRGFVESRGMTQAEALRELAEALRRVAARS